MYADLLFEISQNDVPPETDPKEGEEVKKEGEEAEKEAEIKAKRKRNKEATA